MASLAALGDDWSEGGSSSLWFNSVIFGEGSDAATVRRRFEELLQKKVGAARQICSLRENERQKIVLAGQGDLKRMFDRIERARLAASVPRADLDSQRAFDRKLEMLGKLVRLIFSGTDRSSKRL